MRQLLFLVIILLSTHLTGQDFTTILEHPNDYRNYEFVTFPNPETNEVYAIAFHEPEINNFTNFLWTINTKNNETKKQSIPNYLLNDFREVKDIFYYKNHIYALNQINNNEDLILRPIAVKGEATSKPQFISLASGKEQLIASHFIEKDFYIFTSSRKKRILKIYKVDLNEEDIAIMKIDMPRNDVISLGVNNAFDERYNTRVVDYNNFNHPNQLLIPNKIYFEKDRIILLQQSWNNRRQNILHEIDFEAKTSKRTVFESGHNSIFVNTAYHNDYIYRFSGSGANMMVDALSLTSDKRTVRYFPNNSINTLPFQTSPAKRISFNAKNETPVLTSYLPNKLFRRPFLGSDHRILGLIEGQQDSISIYVGYTPTELNDNSFIGWDIPLPYHLLNYYFIETNLPLATKNISNDNHFDTPNFAKVIAKCNSQNIRTRVFNPRAQKYLLVNEVAGVQIHRLDDGFYGSYFNRKNNEFGFKKLVDLN